MSAAAALVVRISISVRSGGGVGVGVSVSGGVGCMCRHQCRVSTAMVAAAHVAGVSVSSGIGCMCWLVVLAALVGVVGFHSALSLFSAVADMCQCRLVGVRLLALLQMSGSLRLSVCLGCLVCLPCRHCWVCLTLIVSSLIRNTQCK